jgi:17beta-estradiol 17-dehydrogenase / very-long-chain 3-oxoacyl-CoA reductase
MSFFNLIRFFIISYILFNIYKVISFIYKNFIRKRKNLGKIYGENSWAMITGATDGIGKGFCEELAREGFNLILVSRTLEKLEKVSKELEDKFKIKTHIVPFDFSKNHDIENYYKNFSNIAENFDVSILVNNVGTIDRGYHHQVPLEGFFNTVNVNIIPQTVLTKIFSKFLTKREKRSAVIDLSSITAELPLPFRAIYSASKCFNYYLSRALAEEYRNFNIDFLCVKPLYVASLMTKKIADGWKVITPEQCASGSLNDLGYENETNGHWIHKLQAAVLTKVPAWILYKVYERKK